ncbi:hypothetical protein [Allosphingosinicella sp.]|uniref:hypothetical protein n=1 Tax=Allosphingosinicella sp. TaxID=2823234 RepID=UPI003D7196D0
MGGLAVPGMPTGSPGMETPSGYSEPFRLMRRGVRQCFAELAYGCNAGLSSQGSCSA